MICSPSALSAPTALASDYAAGDQVRYAQGFRDVSNVGEPPQQLNDHLRLGSSGLEEHLLPFEDGPGRGHLPAAPRRVGELVHDAKNGVEVRMSPHN